MQHHPRIQLAQAPDDKVGVASGVYKMASSLEMHLVWPSQVQFTAYLQLN